MKVVLLHLSDIHIKTSDDQILKRGGEIASCLYPFLPLASHIFIVVSGDVAFSGKDSQYSLAANFLQEIKAAIQKEKPSPISFIISPGNHDCNFEQESGTRKTLLSNLDDPQIQNNIDSSFIEACTSIQDAFFKFRSDLEANNEAIDDHLWRSSLFKINGKSIGFDCLNVSWASSYHESSGKLYFPIHKYTEEKKARC